MPIPSVVPLRGRWGRLGNPCHPCDRQNRHRNHGDAAERGNAGKDADPENPMLVTSPRDRR
jgi:hypothetical protein